MSEDGRQPERRLARRYRIQVPVEYEQASARESGTTWDVSGSRVAMSHASPSLSIGSEVKLRFSFFVGSFGVAFAANVVRHTPDGFAVQFDRLGSTHHDVLQQALPGGSGRSA